MGYSNYYIQFKPGLANQVAHALSWKFVGEVEMGTLVSIPGIN